MKSSYVQKHIKAKPSLAYFGNQPGSAPGTLRIKQSASPPEIVLIDYNAQEAVRVTNLTPQACADYLDTESVSWVDVAGLGNEETWQQLSQVFNLHSLVLEAVVNVPQRPKLETYPDRLVIVAQMILLQEEGFWLEQVSLILGTNYLLTVQEEPKQDCFNPVRDRIRANKGIVRSQGADYLAYALWDAVIDGYFLVLESYGDRIDALEDEVVLNPTNQTLAQIHQIRQELLTLRRAIWPQRDAINELLRDGHPLIAAEVLPYLRNCYDHTVQIIDMVENYRELASGLMDVYLSAASNKMNEIMQLLTLISTIFIPLTFIAGIYGMNFNPDASPWNMPELNWYWGYPVCLAVMGAIASCLGIFFWRRGWLRNASKINRRQPH